MKIGFRGIGAFLLLFFSISGLWAQSNTQKVEPQAVEDQISLDKLPPGVEPVSGKRQSNATHSQIGQLTGASPDVDLSMYRRCLKIRDYGTAIDAAWRYCLRSGLLEYQDSILALYVQSGRFAPAVLLGNEIVESQPQNAFAWEMLAMTRMALNQKEEALKAYEKVWQLEQDPYHLYQVASLQFQLERIGECRKNTAHLLGLSLAAKDKVRIFAGQEAQEVPLEAATWNLNGNLSLYQKDKKAAKAAFERALEIYPEFKLAQGNLDAL